MSPVKRIPACRNTETPPVNQPISNQIVHEEKSQILKQTSSAKNENGELVDSRNVADNEIKLVNTSASNKTTKNKRPTDRSEASNVQQDVNPIEFNGITSQKTANQKRVSNNENPGKSRAAGKSKIDDTDGKENAQCSDIANATKFKKVTLNKPRSKKGDNSVETKEIHLNKLSLEGEKLGFVDLDGRCYTFLQENSAQFFDDHGHLYTVDRSKRGYFDEEKNHFKFDETYLDENKKTSEAKRLLENFIDNDPTLDTSGTPVIHPIKRRLTVFASDIMRDQKDSNNELEKLKVDPSFKEDEFPDSSVSKSKKGKGREKVGKEKIVSPSDTCTLSANDNEAKIKEIIATVVGGGANSTIFQLFPS